jgi:hypothetical protein
MIGMDSPLKNKAKEMKVSPKPKEQVLAELEELRKQLGLTKTSGDMSITRSIGKKVGSLTNVLAEMRENEK